MKKLEKDTPTFPVFRVVTRGTDVEFTDNRKSADLAFKEAEAGTNLWEVQESGSAALLRSK